MKKSVSMGVVFLLSAFCLGGCSDNGKKTALEFNIASFNVGFCRAPNDVPVWNKRKDLIMPLAEYHDFDIVGMQEPFGFQVDYLLSKSPLYAAAGNIVRDLSLADVSKESAAKNVDRMLRNMNNPIFYKTEKFDLLSAGKFYFSDTPDKDVRGFGGGFDSIRSCVWTKFRDKKSGKIFFVFNIHLCVEKFQEYHKPAAELLLAKIWDIAEKSTFFITGDFNETKLGYAVGCLNQSGRVKDARENSAEKPYGITKSTFHGYKNVSAGELPIDFIFVSKDVEVLKFGTLGDHDNGVTPSDHYPIVARVKIK